MATLSAQQNLFFKEKKNQAKLFYVDNLIICRIISTNIFSTKSLSTLSYKRMHFLYAFLVGDKIDLHLPTFVLI